MIVRPFSLTTPDGEAIDGDVRIPAGPPPRAAVVVVHGFKGFKDWGFFPHLATELAHSGYLTITFNFSRNGVRMEAPLEFTDLEGFAGNTFSRELAELAQVIDAAFSGDLTGRPVRRLGVFGHSRGGGLAILAAAADPRVEALTTWGAVATFDRWSEDTIREWRAAGRLYVLNSRTGQQMPLDVGLLEDFRTHERVLDVTRAASELTIPWLVVHGDADGTVKPEDAHRLVAASSHARLVLVEGGGHTLGAVHPLDGVPSELEQGIEVTRRYFRDQLPVD